ncbi:hypothetical protein GCM10027280_46170 [Micromonospora polyrhachis]|uniref:Uncharacterized protein n=1 Tax=Micromonospora polyrhachis TaxID=1282883 RepID=A0A7W7SQQ4_9ACTN|nr:hypothetical protein [Micromonospora polyrhachis]MBB4959227.1 hypothetical protein [Micromonospora polyrhachis]
MNVLLLDVVKATPLRVIFTCAVGAAAGIWRDTEVPTPGQQVDVEWEIRDPVQWGVSAVPATEATDFIGSRDAAVVMRGRIEPAQGRDSVVTIRVGDGLVLTEIADLPERSVGYWVELRNVKVDLYPTGI